MPDELVRRPVEPNDDETNEKGTSDMKLTTTTQGLRRSTEATQGTGAASEAGNRRNGSERGGMARREGVKKDTMTSTKQNLHQRCAHALLLGRWQEMKLLRLWGTFHGAGKCPGRAVVRPLETWPKNVGIDSCSRD